CYYDAVEAADTLSSDCDYSTLMSIWGQIAMILSKQSMPVETLAALNYYQKYALLNVDTLNYIKGLELSLMSYNTLRDTTKIIETAENVRRLYLEHGFSQQAARTVTSAIYVWLSRHDYDKVRKLQLVYETQSGLFDEYGNITKGKEHYYFGKGMYYEGIGKLDSAEYFYRKLFNARHTFDACNGLTRIYKKIGNIDSVSYYSTLKDSVFDEMVTDLHTEAMRQVKGMYDYSRNQKIALQKEQEAFRGKLILAFLIFLFLVMATVSYLIHLKFRKKKIAEISVLNESYLSTALLYKKVLNEQELLKHDYKLHQETKEQEICTLNRQLIDLQTQYKRMTSENKKVALHTSNIVKCFHHFSPLDNEHPNDTDWEELDLILSQCDPSCYSMIKHCHLNMNEQHVCMLVRIGCTSKEISNLLHTKPQHVTNIKSAANSKLFNDKSARTLEENLTMVMIKN
ncbi:MAG: hypothetical protein Q4A15_05255, partial [Prevotellaceae bacterium]|nr:hypothetical protein [Prevotellaceae bacterium]